MKYQWRHVPPVMAQPETEQLKARLDAAEAVCESLMLGFRLGDFDLDTRLDAWVRLK